MKRNAIVFALMFVVAVPVIAQPPEQKEDISLHQAVMAFNQREANQFEETDQHWLTENELICAIRRLPISAKEQKDQPGFSEILQIAETEILPPNAYLSLLRGSYTDTHYCTVFDIQLTFKTGEKSHLTVPIRQTARSSRKIRLEERRELEKKFASLQKNTQTE